METPKPGDVILGKYEVTALLGQGGMGVVLAARHRDHRGLVALKFLLPAARKEPEVVARFMQEARTAIRIKSRHVAQVFDVDTVDGVPFIVMEHLTGRDLAAVIRERGPIPVQETADLLLQACEAVQEAHSLGVVHRDLTPRNLFVATTSDGSPILKVLDFGISKSSDAHDVAVTANGAVIGSPPYMSPEQLASSKSVDARTDVWALGVILYEMLTGVPPFTGESFGAVYAAIMRGEYADASTRCPDLPEELEELIAHALMLERDDRLSSVEAFAAVLSRFGTPATAPLSYERVQRLASLTPEPPEPGVAASKPPAPPSPTGATGAAPLSARTDAPRESAPPGQRAWRPMAALGAVVAAGALALAAPSWLRHPSAGADAPTASASAVPASATSGEVAPSGSATPLAPAGAVAEIAPAPSSLPLARAEEPAPGASTQAPADSSAARPVRAVPAPTAVVAGCAAGATATCEAACAAKAPGACLKLAEALDDGVGAPRNAARAATLYKTECDGGAFKACNDLGILLAKGDGVPRDPARAVDLYARACEGHHATACVNLGAMHAAGSGVDKNESLGARFYLRGCEEGSGKGCLKVALAYEDGRGVPKDPAQSFAYAGRACAAGDRAGCAFVEFAKVRGDGVAKDAQALPRLDAMCARREVAACEDLALLYAQGAGAEVPVDPLRVRSYRKKACDLGSQVSCQVGQVLGKIDTGDGRSAQESALLQGRCDAGEAAACGTLGEILLGSGVAADRAKGVAHLEKACRGGYARACGKLDGGPP